VSNSLTELNNFSNQTIIFEDNRAYEILFSADTPVNQSIAVDEDLPFLSPVGTNITKIVSQPGPITYNILLQGFGSNVELTWPALPPTVSIINTGPALFSISGFFTVDTWNQVRNPSIRIKDRDQNFTYSAYIEYPSLTEPNATSIESWTINASVTASDELTNPITWTYVKNSPGTIDGNPIIVDAFEGGEYTITVTPTPSSALASLTTSGQGGVVDFNTTSKILTISGTKQQVNSHLSSMFFTPTLNTVQNIELGYVLTNPISNLTTTKIQTLAASDLPYNLSAITYDEDTPKNLQFQIVDESTTAEFTVSITQSQPSLSTNPGNFLVNNSNVGNTVNLSGSRSVINATQITYIPPIDWAQDITLSISQSKVDQGNTFIQATNNPWTLQNSLTNPEIVNMVNRSYTSNTTKLSFFQNPTAAITDGPDIGQTYTITLTSNRGRFGTTNAAAAANSTYSFTGNLTATNNQLSTLRFVPNPGANTDGTFTYTQSRNGVSQVNTTLNLTALEGSAITPRTLVFTQSGLTFTPTEQEFLYGNIQILTVGGGGAANRSTSQSPHATGTGGGAGGEVKITNVTRGSANSIQQTQYAVTVGAGGLRNTNGLPPAQAGSPTFVSAVSGGNIAVSVGGGAGGPAPALTTSSNPSRGGNVAGKIGGAGTNQSFTGSPERYSYFGGGGASSLNNGGSPVNIGAQTRAGNGADGLFVGTGWGPYTTYGGGGGGGSGLNNDSTLRPGFGGAGGGGVGNGQPGLSNSGGGGGGNTGQDATSLLRNGGSGIVVIKIT
jgi:hypothetical protein